MQLYNSMETFSAAISKSVAENCLHSFYSKESEVEVREDSVSPLNI